MQFAGRVFQGAQRQANSFRQKFSKNDKNQTKSGTAEASFDVRNETVEIRQNSQTQNSENQARKTGKSQYLDILLNRNIMFLLLFSKCWS